MADVRLVVGVDTGASEKQIIGDIDSIISSINKSPRKIKIEFDFDQNSSKTLASIQKALSSLDTSGASGLKNISQQLRDLGSASKEGTTSLQAQINNLVGLNRETKSAKDSANTMKMAWAMQKEEAKQLAQVEKEAAQALKEYEQASKSTNNTSTELQRQIDAWVGIDNATKSAKQSADNMKMAWAMQKEEARQLAEESKRAAAEEAAAAKQVAAEEKEKANALKEELQIRQSIATLRSKVIGASDWTAALYSTGEAKDAYLAIQNIDGALANLETRFRSGEISSADYKNAIRQLNIEYREQANVIKEAGANHKSFLDSMGSITQIIARYVSVYKIFQMAVRTIKQMVNEVIRLDDAMTQLRVVTDNTEAEYSRFSKTVASTAREIGASVTDLIDSTTTYARLGYSLEEASELSRFTAMLQNVGKRYCLAA